MFCRARNTLFGAMLVLLPVAGGAQVVWQPTAPPLVTAENTGWFSTGDPVEWNDDLYYPGGAVQHFNRYQMVRTGSFKGIPLYTDTTLQPNSIVFVPLSGERMQPYERLRTGELAGTTGSRAPSFPPEIGNEGSVPAGIVQALAAPSRVAAYDPAVPAPPDDDRTSLEPAPVGTSGRLQAPSRPTVTATLAPPSGLNAVWVNFEGRRWYGGGRAVEYDPEGLVNVGTYHGWAVYSRSGDRSTIYIPSVPGRLTPYSLERRTSKGKPAR